MLSEDRCRVCSRRAEGRHHIWPRGRGFRGQSVSPRVRERMLDLWPGLRDPIDCPLNLVELCNHCHDVIQRGQFRFERQAAGLHFSVDGIELRPDAVEADFIFGPEGELLWRSPLGKSSDSLVADCLHGAERALDEYLRAASGLLERATDIALESTWLSTRNLGRYERQKLDVALHAEMFNRTLFFDSHGKPASDWSRCEAVAQSLGIHARTVWRHVLILRKLGMQGLWDHQGPLTAVLDEEAEELEETGGKPRRCCRPAEGPE